MLQALIYWALLIPLAIANGVLRESTYGKRMGERAAHQLSTVLGIVLFGCYFLVLSRHWAIEDAGAAWTWGGLWLALTVAFEFGFGRWVGGHSWSKLLGDYNILKGRLWLLMLLWTGLGPRLIHALGARPA